jgi:predicted ATPase/DNA-binding SARP family transcriptional activator
MRFGILGPLLVADDQGRELALGGPKQRAVLAVLLLHAREVVSSDRLIDDLWGERAPASAAKNVQAYVSGLRKALGVGILLTRAGGYALEVEPGEIDAERFWQLAGDGHDLLEAGDVQVAAARLREALGLWRGPALADFSYEPFAQAELARLEEARLVAIEDRIDADLALGGHAMLVGELEAFVRERPLRERPRGQLMLALYRSGRQPDVLAAYRDAVAALEEIGLQPGPELRRVEDRIVRHDPSLLAPAYQERPSPRVRPGLPAALSPIVGRERERSQIIEAMLGEGGVRLLTITGPGGVGKTRLALEVARVLADRFDGGAGFVALAGLARIEPLDPEAVSPAGWTDGRPTAEPVMGAIANAVGVHEQPGRSLGSLVIDRLDEERLLLVLDNFEHVLGAASIVSLLLGSCSGLSVLATSREALRMPGEHEHPLAPLGVPATGAERARVRASDAVQLFAERARAVAPGFALDDDDAVAVGEICRRLDGLPLALELAAARVKVLAPAAILARLQRRLPLLSGGARGAPERQRTLEATIAWSHDLLTAQERRAFGRLAIFRGGFSLEAAEAVCGVEFDLVCSLVDKSLLYTADERFFMLETIREYAHDQLAASPEAQEVARRHAEWVAALVTDAQPQLYGPDHVAWARRLDLEHDNLRAALDFARVACDHSLQLSILAACWYYWYLRVNYAEAESRLEAALPTAPPNSPLRRELLNGLFVFHWYQGRAERAASLAQESLALRSRLPADAGLLRSLINAALIAGANADMDTATRLLEECAVAASALGQPWARAIALINLADAALRLGAYQDAAAHANEAVAIYDEIGEFHGHAIALANLAAAELELGRLEAAVTHYRQALTQLREDPSPDTCYYCVDGLAAAAADDGRARTAAELLGLADAVAATSNFAVQGFEQTRRERTLTAIAARLAPADVERERGRAAGLPPAAAIDHALQAASQYLASAQSPATQALA